MTQRGNGKRKYGHPDVRANVYYLDGTRMGVRKRVIFRAHPNPNYGVLRDGREVQYLQIGITNRHKWYLKGSPFNDDGTWKVK